MQQLPALRLAFRVVCGSKGQPRNKGVYLYKLLVRANVLGLPKELWKSAHARTHELMISGGTHDSTGHSHERVILHGEARYRAPISERHR